jgi:hypothetical protein
MIIIYSKPRYARGFTLLAEGPGSSSFGWFVDNQHTSPHLGDQLHESRSPVYNSARCRVIVNYQRRGLFHANGSETSRSHESPGMDTMGA